MSTLSTNPPIPASPVDDPQTKQVSAAWYQFFQTLWRRTGGATGGTGVPGGTTGEVQYNAGSGEFGGYTSPQLTSQLSVTGEISNAGGTLNLVTQAATTLLGNASLTAAVPGPVAIGANLTLSSAGTLSGTAGGTVTDVATQGPGITGGPITTAGTLAVEWNAGTVSTLVGASVATGTLTTNWDAGTVSALGNNLTITSGTINVLAGPSFTSLTISVDNSLILTGQTSDAGTAAGTLTNAPTAGNPAFWLRLQVNGTNLAIPCWTA